MLTYHCVSSANPISTSFIWKRRPSSYKNIICSGACVLEARFFKMDNKYSFRSNVNISNKKYIIDKKSHFFPPSEFCLQLHAFCTCLLEEFGENIFFPSYWQQSTTSVEDCNGSSSPFVLHHNAQTANSKQLEKMDFDHHAINSKPLCYLSQRWKKKHLQLWVQIQLIKEFDCGFGF